MLWLRSLSADIDFNEFRSIFKKRFVVICLLIVIRYSPKYWESFCKFFRKRHTSVDRKPSTMLSTSLHFTSHILFFLSLTLSFTIQLTSLAFFVLCIFSHQALYALFLSSRRRWISCINRFFLLSFFVLSRTSFAVLWIAFTICSWFFSSRLYRVQVLSLHW